LGSDRRCPRNPNGQEFLWRQRNSEWRLNAGGGIVPVETSIAGNGQIRFA
jgi:hypothetical protein